MKKTLITAQGSSLSKSISEVVHHRELLMMLAWRDFKIRYSQTFFGLAWVILRPALTLGIFIIVFQFGIKLETEINYPLFALSGMMIWNLFSTVISGSGTSLITAQQMIRKIYFPRILLPLSKIWLGMVDFLVVFVGMLVLMLIQKTPVYAQIAYFPLFLALAILAAVGLGLWVSALSLRYRDFQHVLPFVIQIGLYASPVAYPSSLIPENWQKIYYLNPMAGIVDGFRWSLLGGSPPPEQSFISYLVLVLIAISGFIYFQKIDNKIADWV